MSEELKVNKNVVPKSAMIERSLLYDMEVYIGKQLLTALTLTANSDKDAITKVAGQLNISIRKRHVPR